MNSLAKFQMDFITASLHHNDNALYSLKQVLRETPQLTTAEQISIYINGINSGLVNALKNIYPVCEKLVGERFFYAIALEYIKTHSSLSPDLANYGFDFSLYLASKSTLNSVPYLSDVAILEWAYHEAFHSKDEAEFSMNILAKYTAEQLTNCVFSLPDSHKLLKSNYPVDEIWRINQTNSEKEITLDYEPVHLYLYRKQHEIHIDRIKKIEFMFLQKINSHQPFLNICEQFSEASDISALLVKSLQLGWINQAQMTV